MDRPPKRRRVAEDARRRVVRACTRCRRLKEKCNGRHPCQRCFRSGHACEFTATDANATGASSRSTTRIALGGEQRNDEHTQCLERLVSQLLGNVPMDVNSLRRISEKIDSSQRAGTEDDELDGLTLEHENFTVKRLSQSTAHYSGEFSHWNFSQKVRQRLVQFLGTNLPTHDRGDIGVAASRRAPRGRKGILEYWRATQLQSPKTLVMSVLDCLPPSHVSEFLVQTYFEFAQTNCFYVEERWLKSKLAFLYEKPRDVTTGDAAWICAVLMVLAIGTQFAHLAAGPPTEPQSSSTDDGSCEEEDAGLTIYQTASKLIPDIITLASLESVQACLLLAHYALPLDTQGLAYTYLGLSIKMAIQNGMHRKYCGVDLDAWTIEMRNRLWWTAYTVESRVRVLHGRPASISPTEIDADLPKDAFEFRQDVISCKQFLNMSALIDMTVRLSDVANAITLLRKCPKSLQATYFERIIEIWQNLHAWWQSLPENVRNPSSHDQLFRSHLHLKLSFHLVEIFIGRPFIFIDKNEASPRATTAQTQQPERPSRREALIDGAVSAAFGVISLCELLHEQTGLARASYTEFSSCRAALLLLLAQSSREYDKRTSEVISSGIRLLKVMATGNNVSTRSETSVVETIEIAVRKLHSRMARDASQATNDELVHENSKSGYESFKEWTSLGKMPDTEEDVINDQDCREAVQGPFQPGGPSWTGNFESMAGSLIWDTVELSELSATSDLDLADIMNAFPQGMFGGGLDE